MYGWQESLLSQFGDSLNNDDLLCELRTHACDIGFEFFAFGIRAPLPVSRPRIVMHNNYPVEWQRRYAEQRYLTSDPSIPKALRSSLPVVWSDDLFAESPQLWDEARQFQLRHGCAQSHIDGGGVRSLLTFARAHEVVTQYEVDAKAQRLQWLTHLLHQRFLDRLGDALLPEAAVKLAEREVEVLRWTAEGKTSADIAEILRISERTVNFHLNNASAKLGTCNKTAASVKAALLGLIW